MSADREYNRVLGWLRNLATYLLVIVLVWLARPVPQSVAFGFALVALGEAMRFWAAGHLFKTMELITSGPYRYTRNPLYLGRLLIFTGIAVMARIPLAGRPWLGTAAVLAVGWGVFFLYYLPRKERVEPARLLEHHGEAYRRYLEAVPALFPRLTPWEGASRESWRRDRMLRNREQWMVVGLLLVAAYFAWRALA